MNWYSAGSPFFRQRSRSLAAFVGAFMIAGQAWATDLPPKLPANDSKLFSPKSVVVDPRWSVTYFAGISGGDSSLLDIISAPWNTDVRGDFFLGAALSYQLLRFYRHFTIDAEIGGGGRFPYTNAGEAWVALYLRYDHFPWNHIIRTRIGLSTGFNYMTALPAAESGMPGSPEPEQSKLLHYLSPEIAFSLPRSPEQEFIIRYHHRSGVFGLVSKVTGGSNVISAGYRYRWN